MTLEEGSEAKGRRKRRRRLIVSDKALETVGCCQKKTGIRMLLDVRLFSSSAILNHSICHH